MLLALVFVAMPLKYLADDPSTMNVVGPMHGFLYVVYLIGTFDLGRRVHWSLRRMVLVALAGTIPFLSFYAERRISRDLAALALRPYLGAAIYLFVDTSSLCLVG